ncbi:uncharacterized protein K460DRAFT_340083 [Cucurbitaria berberidis CBS 394.84]|uniref:Uncharacterized protein n=1 Tax=Cucurbitaria berberidis CBS 394.84 TaxID=1168544 RepID=A0A9P4L5J2_9PLEO|nr:uncharacterized protein K460DRAFT_340083 [Cucurbitaria berberidis CBS 394.84]KAF1842720.1 hypothetical protein K460DRAFT_340083 [Cucurbitaria berberidis CBS 394.84]
MTKPRVKKRPHTRSSKNSFGQHKVFVEFKKDQDFTGRLSKDTYDEMYRRGCIEDKELPPMDLQNPIHPVFRREAFTDISDDEYERIRPALTLASRLITEEEYMGFWTHICTGRPVDDNRRGKMCNGRWRNQVIEAATVDSQEALAQTQQTLLNMADNLSFVVLDEEWSKTDWMRAAESFTDPGHRQCRRNEDLGEDRCALGECAHCDSNSQARCHVCHTSYYNSKTIPQLKELLWNRSIPHAYGNFRLKEDLVAALEHLDEVMEEDYHGQDSAYRTTDEQLSNLQVGLHWDVVKHIRDGLEDEVWTESEETRFQMAVGATLCHELAHMFWWWTQRRCWNCEGADPWWSKTEATFNSQPEIGNSWEYWAFGSRVPGAGKLHECTGQELPNIFQRCQWNWIDSTEQGGQGKHSVLIHDFILPVEYTNLWFRESTWEAIAQNGRKMGRPSHDNLVIMRELPTDLVQENAFGNYECTIEKYSHKDLVANGGFNGNNNQFLYGSTGLITKAQTDVYVRKLRRELCEKRQKERKATKRKPTKVSPGKKKPTRDVQRTEERTEGPKTRSVTKQRTRETK